jgi:hypothetical protein
VRATTCPSGATASLTGRPPEASAEATMNRCVVFPDERRTRCQTDAVLLFSMKPSSYDHTLADVTQLLASARAAAARSINTVMTATYFLVGRRIVEAEQHGRRRAGYGEQLIDRLAADLTKAFGRGFGRSNLMSMRAFFLEYESIVQMPSGQSFPLPWSHYTRLLSVRSASARRFYEREALKGGWTFKQLDRQIQTQFYERTALSTRRVEPSLEAQPARELLKEPYLLEFLDL